MLEGLEPTSRKYSCKTNTIIQSLNEADKKILLNALDNPEWTNTALTVALNNRGIKISRYSIDSHRNKVCSCWRI